ncbi:hypothetical protein Esti_002344 [Eimeria stiedai]
MNGGLQALSPVRPTLCLSLSPPLLKSAEACLAHSGIYQAEQLYNVKSALAGALEAALETTTVGAIKFDTAYYEQFGPCGMQALADTIDSMPSHVAAIIDGRRGDISSTAAAYARAFFDYYRADAITISSYMGRDAICPFISHSDAACVFVDCRPAGCVGIARLKGFEATSRALYEHVASLCQEVAAAKQGKGTLGLMAGVRDPQEGLAVWQLRKAFPTMPFMLDFHCEVSALFSQITCGEESSQAFSNLIVCVNPPRLQDASTCAQNALKQLESALPEVFAS